MSFLDKTGLAYFYSKLKNKFVQSVNKTAPNINGDVEIINVATANNLTSPDNVTSYDTFIYRTAGGEATIQSGEARLLYIEGNSVVSGRVQESISASINNNLEVNVNASIWRNTGYGENSGTYTFYYYKNSNSWNPSLESTGITVTGVHTSSISASYSGNLTNVTVTKSTWESQISNTGNYYLIYQDNNWKLNNNIINLQTYGIVITGTPNENDTITISYESATPDSTLIIQYVKANRGTINVATPSEFMATGLNQFDKTSMVLNNMNIINNTIVSEAGKYICYCQAVGSVPNGYVAYSSSGAIENIGWSASLPAESGTVVTNGAEVTSTLASINFNNDGYVVVVTTSIDDICIHPRWSGATDEVYAPYSSPSEIIFPEVGILDGQSKSLPLNLYGMPSVGIIADKLDFDKQIYIQNIGRQDYTEINLETIQALNVEYDYDDTNIYYVLPSPKIYTIESDMIYFVNDFGTEEFIGTSTPVVAQILYGENLRDKLRFNVEFKKMIFEDVAVTAQNFSNNSPYAHYSYRVAISLSGVDSTMMPQVILDEAEATTSVFAPISETYDGGVYLYANKILSSGFTIPTIICWHGEV